MFQATGGNLGIIMAMVLHKTGQVLSRQNIEEIIKFSKEEGLVLMADEVNIAL